MSISYKKLWHLLIEHEMKKSDLVEQTGLSWKIMSKLNKGENIRTDIIERICIALNCQPGDIMEVIPDEE
jgi:DNA-binding Xre family transcriptional regulator